VKLSLSPTDLSHLKAAEGWLELGNWHEANEELELIMPQLRAHPNVLEMRCRIYEAAGKWEMSLAVSETLCQQLPKRLNGWLHQARCLHALGKTHEAYHLLVDVVELFPDNQTIRYDIAVYAAQRELLAESVEWLKLVFKVDGDGEFRKRALEDQRLDRVWREIGSLPV
jgi:tetratricopeptide (TPR) repeat protein